MVILRKTSGFHKESDEISYSQFVKFTGRTNKAVRNAIKALVKKCFVEYQQGSIKGVSNRYRIIDNPVQALLGKLHHKVGYKNTPPPRVISGTDLGYKSTHTKEILQKKEDKSNSKEKETGLQRMKQVADSL